MHRGPLDAFLLVGEGRSYVKAAWNYFRQAKKPTYFVPFAVQSAYRLVGYKLGKNYTKLSHRQILKCTANPNYFHKHWS